MNAFFDSVFDPVFTAGPPSLGLEARPGTLDPESARAAAKAALDTLTIDPGPDRRLLLQGISLLWHDHWEPAHEIAQSREGEPSFDLLHAILHRREGDFANAGYWFRAVGKHPCYPMLERRLAAGESGAAMLPGQTRWSPEAFLKQVQAGLRAEGGTKKILMLTQAEEFRAFAQSLLAPL